MKPVVRFAAVLVLVSSGALAARAGVSPERTFLICQASGVTTEEDARPYVDGFGKYLAGKLGWSPDSWEVRFETGSCLKVLDTWKPAYATIPLGDFLAAETRLSMIPLVLAKVAGKSTGRYRILVKKGAYGSLDALKGKILLGNLVGDAAFLSRVILKGALDAATHFVLQQMSRPLKAIRDVAKGKADAVLVDDLQYDSLKQLSVFPDLQVVFTSEEVPNLGLVYLKTVARAADVSSFSAALVGMCSDPEGKEICKTFSLEGFVPVTAGALDGVRALFGRK